MADSADDRSENPIQCTSKRKRKTTHNDQCKKPKLEINCANSAIMEKLSSYFERDENNVIVCKVMDCRSTISRWQLYNFKRHFDQRHPILLGQLFPEAVKDELRKRIEKIELLYHAIELVTVNGFPFAILNTSAMRGILKKQLDELEKSGFKMSLDRHTIVDKIKELSDKIRNRISTELMGKLFSIMFDVCTKRTFSVLGITSTFMENGSVIARSMGTVQLKERHRGPYMSNVIDETLQKYGLKVNQIISATADQASNMDNTARHLAIRATNETSEGISSDEDDNSSENGSESDEARMELVNRIELQIELNNDDRYIDLVTEMVHDIQRKNNLLSMVPKQHCCAHTVQLGIKRAIRESDETSHILEIVREMMKSLRTTVINVKFRKLAPHVILPKQYIDIRWNSDYQMV